VCVLGAALLSAALLGVGLLGVGLLGGCAHDFAVERRDTPVHVWISAPALGARGASIPALVYVGSEKAVEGTIAFPQGTSTVILPTIRMTEGKWLVQAVFAGGAITVSDDVHVKGETWIEILIQNRAATIHTSDQQPPIPR
jgi:hypothetical protein